MSNSSKLSWKYFRESFNAYITKEPYNKPKKRQSIFVTTLRSFEYNEILNDKFKFGVPFLNIFVHRHTFTISCIFKYHFRFTKLCEKKKKWDMKENSCTISAIVFCIRWHIYVYNRFAYSKRKEHSKEKRKEKQLENGSF